MENDSNDDAARLAPGQQRTRKFPVTGESRASQELSIHNWRLEITGAVEQSRTLDFAELLALPQETLARDIHCVTGWSRLGLTFEGVPFQALLSLVRVQPTGRFVRFTAYSDRRHDTSLPLDLAIEDSWLVHRVDGSPLTPKHGFPVRVVTPSRYFYKSLKWLKSIEFLEQDQLGFWERTSAYHNHGDPWKEERYEGTRFTSQAEVDAFRSLDDYAEWRDDDQVVLMASLRGWQPKTLDLEGLQLKASDLRDAKLSGANFRGANLTRSRFAGADLTGCDFTEADLEGADFSGARLNGAVFARNCLSAATFAPLAGHYGMKMIEPQGLLESEEAYLRSIGVLV